MKRPSSTGIVLLVIGGIIIAYVAFTGTDLKTQLLTSPTAPGADTTPDGCRLLSEDAANDCYTEIAVREKKASVCDQITKASEKRSCQREVQLAP